MTDLFKPRIWGADREKLIPFMRFTAINHPDFYRWRLEQQIPFMPDEIMNITSGLGHEFNRYDCYDFTSDEVHYDISIFKCVDFRESGLIIFYGNNRIDKWNTEPMTVAIDCIAFKPDKLEAWRLKIN